MYLLDIHYICIDSLCIVQNDSEEWQREGSKMADVYSLAYLTLAASKASDSSQGLYAGVQAHMFSYPDSEDEMKQCALFAYQNKLSFKDEVFPLCSRAWFLQERLLSPRVVHFAGTQLWWECRRYLVSERGRFDRSQETAGIMMHSTHNLPPTIGQSQSELFKWHTIVRLYTASELSNERDMLPAIQGLAKAVQAWRRSAYFAGLWANS
jgi:hypothetical protein